MIFRLSTKIGKKMTAGFRIHKSVCLFSTIVATVSIMAFGAGCSDTDSTPPRPDSIPVFTLTDPAFNR